MTNIWQGWFYIKNNGDGVSTDVAAETDVYDIKDAHQILTADDNSEVIMPDGQVVPSLAKVIKSISDSK